MSCCESWTVPCSGRAQKIALIPIRDIRWHDPRHTCATLLLGRDDHPKLV